MSEHELPRQLKFGLRSGGDFIDRVCVMLTLTMKRKNDLKVLIGPSARDGWIHVAGIDLERRIADLQEMFPMDYADMTAWTGEIGAEVVGLEGVERLGASLGSTKIELELDRETAEAVLSYLRQVGEHVAAGAPLPGSGGQDPRVELVGEFLSALSQELGGPGRLA